jgi:hypothetical protein
VEKTFGPVDYGRLGWKHDKQFWARGSQDEMIEREQTFGGFRQLTNELTGTMGLNMFYLFGMVAHARCWMALRRDVCRGVMMYFATDILSLARADNHYHGRQC